MELAFLTAELAAISVVERCADEERIIVEADRIEHREFNADRINLAELRVEIRFLKEAITSLRDALGDAHRATKADFTTFRDEVREDNAKRDGKIESLQNFRWWIMGASLGFGALVHFVLDVVKPH